MPKVEIYTTTVCPYCVRAKQLLAEKGIAYEEISAEDPDVRTKMIARADGRRTVPQIFINGKLLGGCDDLYRLHANGELDQWLKGE